jgi:hypothetical protein
MVKISRYDSVGQMVYRNFNNKSIKLRQTKVGPLDPFSIDDDWKTIDWKVFKNKKKIAGYNCQKAVGYFRGREYTVWFTEEIKNHYGPWKLFGLPGLIVKASDKDNVFNVEMINIEFNKERLKISPPVESLNKTLKEYVYYLDHSGDLIYEKLKTKKLPKGMSIGPVTKLNTIQDARNVSFEKLYEWETGENQKQKNSLDLIMQKK